MRILTIEETNLDATLSELAGLCKQASARSEPVFQQRLRAKQFSKDTLREAGEAAHEIVKDARQEIYRRLDDVCNFYLTASDSQRSHLRELVTDHSHPLRYYMFDYAVWCSKQIESPSDTDPLKRGLAALSLENCAVDWRDTFLALGEIYVKGKKLRMGVEDELRYVASISSDKPPYPNSGLKNGTKGFLEEFEKSAFFKESVRPRLKDSS